jgi:hypothetical protein
MMLYETYLSVIYHAHFQFVSNSNQNETTELYIYIFHIFYIGKEEKGKGAEKYAIIKSVILTTILTTMKTSLMFLWGIIHLKINLRETLLLEI